MALKLTLAVFNHLVSQNPAVRQELQACCGRSLYLQFPLYGFGGVLNAEGLLEPLSGDADTVITFHKSAVTKMLCAEKPGIGDFDIAGDTGLGTRLLPAIGNLNYRAANDVSALFGEAAGKSFQEAQSRVKADLKDAGIDLTESAAEYARSRTAPVAGIGEYRLFAAAVSTLRDDTARTEARLRQLQQRIGAGTQILKADVADLAWISTLYAANSRNRISRPEDGFVQASPAFPAFMKSALEKGYVYKAVWRGMPAGVLTVSRDPHPSGPPIMRYINEHRDDLLADGIPFSQLKTAAYGPVLTDSRFRGMGIARKLFDQAVADLKQAEFDAFYAFIDAANSKSLSVHTQGLGMRIVREVSLPEGGHFFIIAKTLK